MLLFSQLVRSPGVYFNDVADKNGRSSFTTTFIPNRGAWLEFDIDAKGVANVRIDRTRRTPISTIIRALGIGTDEEIEALFGNDIDSLNRATEKDLYSDTELTRTEEALIDIFERLRPGEPKIVENSRSALYQRFFDPKRYDLGSVGRYKMNKKTFSFKIKSLIWFNFG